MDASASTSKHRERRPWTAEEDAWLRQGIELEDPGTNSPSKWNAIATHVPGRTNKDCRKRWYSKMSAEVLRGGWSQEEDDRLREAIEAVGPKWSLVASMVGTRNSDQCAKRWGDALNPSINRGVWSPSQDDLLRQAVAEHGTLWTKIVKMYFPGRTGLSAKNRYHSLTRNEASTSTSATTHADLSASLPRPRETGPTRTTRASARRRRSPSPSVSSYSGGGSNSRSGSVSGASSTAGSPLSGSASLDFDLESFFFSPSSTSTSPSTAPITAAPTASPRPGDPHWHAGWQEGVDGLLAPVATPEQDYWAHLHAPHHVPHLQRTESTSPQLQMHYDPSQAADVQPFPSGHGQEVFSTPVAGEPVIDFGDLGRRSVDARSFDSGLDIVPSSFDPNIPILSDTHLHPFHSGIASFDPAILEENSSFAAGPGDSFEDPSSAAAHAHTHLHLPEYGWDDATHMHDPSASAATSLYQHDSTGLEPHAGYSEFAVDSTDAFDPQTSFAHPVDAHVQAHGQTTDALVDMLLGMPVVEYLQRSV